MCVLLITRLLRLVGRWARKPDNHTSWVALVTPTDRPKSVRNRCLIELFCGVVCVVTCPFDISVGVGAFVIGLGQISSFLSEKRKRRISRYSYLMKTLISSEYGLTISGHVTVLRQWLSEKNTDYIIIRHIAITNCPFRSAFSHLPRCGQLLRQKHENNVT